MSYISKNFQNGQRLTRYCKKINDRFTFDSLFRRLLKANLNKTEALNYILNKYSLSTLVVQERIENKFYRKIKPDEEISTDLLEFKDGFFRRKFNNEVQHLGICGILSVYEKHIQTSLLRRER